MMQIQVGIESKIEGLRKAGYQSDQYTYILLQKINTFEIACMSNRKADEHFVQELKKGETFEEIQRSTGLI